jgi:hypothetical protein
MASEERPSEGGVGGGGIMRLFSTKKTPNMEKNTVGTN